MPQSSEPLEKVATIDWSDEQDLSTSIVSEICSLTDKEADSINPPLYNLIDPSALNGLYSLTSNPNTECNGSIEFQFHSYWVSVNLDGTADIYE